MPRELYKDFVAYLHKRVTTDNTATWDEIGIPFYCNREAIKKSRWHLQANTYAGTAEEILKTSTQLEFEINDKITFIKTPYNDANNGDFSMIGAIDKKPILTKGSKHRNRDYFEYWITKSG
jgi:hypothetical protein